MSKSVFIGIGTFMQVVILQQFNSPAFCFADHMSSSPQEKKCDVMRLHHSRSSIVYSYPLLFKRLQYLAMLM